MSLERRRRFVFLVLILVAGWPLAHRMLVDGFLVNPWELGGFAMYVQPDRSVEVRMHSPAGEFVEHERFGAEVSAAFKNYCDNAETLGFLANAEALSTALRRAGWSYEHVEIEIRRPMIAPDGTLVMRAARRRIVTQ